LRTASLWLNPRKVMKLSPVKVSLLARDQTPWTRTGNNNMENKQQKNYRARVISRHMTTFSPAWQRLYLPEMCALTARDAERQPAAVGGPRPTIHCCDRNQRNYNYDSNPVRYWRRCYEMSNKESRSKTFPTKACKTTPGPFPSATQN